MKQTYEDAITRVFADEGGYSNDAGDPGGPTNWGITIADARLYWKANATASDVRNLPKSVAEEIYAKHYAAPVRYNDLPSGVDYAILDYGVNSGTGRAVKVLQRLVGVNVDGQMGSATLAAVYKKDQKELINAIYAERMAFLRALGTWRLFGRGWTSRCTGGKKLALELVDKYPWKQPSTSVPVVAGTTGLVAVGAAAASAGHDWKLWLLAGGVAALFSALGYYEYKIHAKH